MENWQHLFIPTHSLLEMFIRATATYLGLFLVVLVAMRREIGSLGVADLLLIMLFAESLQNALASDYKSITEGLFTVCVLLFWNYVVDWLIFRFPTLERWLEPPPLLLVRDGRVLHRNLRREMITLNELERQLRENGVEDIAKVRSAYIEGDGKVSVVVK